MSGASLPAACACMAPTGDGSGLALLFAVVLIGYVALRVEGWL